MADGDPRACRICGDTEPFHVHVGSQEPGARRLENYFTVGRGLSDFQSALAWQRKYQALRQAAIEFESDLSEYCDGPARDALRALLHGDQLVMKGKGLDDA